VDRDILLVLGMPPEGMDSRAPALVNGSLRPDITATSGERLRLRLINANASRGLAVRLEGHAAWVMAIDGQPAEPALARDSRLALGPGNRAGVADEQPIARLVYAPGRRGPASAPIRPGCAAAQSAAGTHRPQGLAQGGDGTCGRKAARSRPAAAVHGATGTGGDVGASRMDIIFACSTASMTAGRLIGWTRSLSASRPSASRSSPTIPGSG